MMSFTSKVTLLFIKIPKCTLRFSDVVYVVQKCIKLFHLTATTIVSFYTCTYIPVGFAVKVVGCYLKIVPSYKFSQHNKKHLRLHSKTFIIN